MINSRAEIPKYGHTTSQDINYKIWLRVDKIYKNMLAQQAATVTPVDETTTGWVTDVNGDVHWLETIVDTTGGITYTYYDSPGGAVTTPVMPITPVTEKDYELSKSCYNVITSGTGYTIGDKLIKLNQFDTSTTPMTFLSTLWFNETTNTSIASPLVVDIEECLPQTKLREELGYEILPFTDTSVVTLTAPLNANLAEIQVQGGTIQYMFGVDPTAAGIWVGSGQRIEAESLDEINKLQIIGASGNSGTLIIHYFCVNTPDGNN